jgi:hypothetical protein
LRKEGQSVTKARPAPRREKGQVDGPWLTAALICESVGQYENGSVADILGKIDGLEFLESEADTAFREVFIIVTFTGGETRGTQTVEIVAHPPGRPAQRLHAEEVFFDGPGAGHDIQIKIPIVAAIEGMYWFDVLLDGRLVTRVPFRVRRMVSLD